MSVENFIPELTRAEVQVAFHRGQVVIPTLTPIPDGEIRTGNAVKIIGASLPEVVDYKAAGRRIEGAEISGDDVTVLIDQEKAVAERVDDVDERQAAGSLSQFTDLHGAALARDADRAAIAALISGGTQGATAAVDNVTKAKTAVRALATAMDNAEVPEDGRYLLVNPAAKALITEWLGDSTAVQSGGDELRKNKVGEVAGFTVIWSNGFPAGITGAAFVAYHEAAAAFAGQIDKTEAVRAGDGFADIVRSLSVYGVKVTRPDAVHTSGFTKPSTAPAAG